MVSLHCTKKLLDRIKPSIATSPPPPTTALGNWYATALFWKPQLALLVSERTLLPVLMPLAPASTLAARFPLELAAVLRRHGVSPAAIEAELAAMAEAWRERAEGADPLALSMRLAETPCGAIKYDSPARLSKALFGGAAH